MSRMSEVHQDLEAIHQILLGQRKVAALNTSKSTSSPDAYTYWNSKVGCINDLLLEIEAAGVVWPDNVVDIGGMSLHPCACGQLVQCHCGR